MARRHCWKSRAEHIREQEGYGEAWAAACDNPETCFLWHEHEGDHEWTPDSEIRISFPKQPTVH